MNGVSRPMAGHESVDAKVAEEKQGFTSIPSFQYLPFNTPLRGALDGCP
jgi:hypothetical protein